MNAVKPLLGFVKAFQPSSAGPSLPAQPLVSSFQAVLGNIVELLQSLFAGSTPKAETVDISKDLGLEHTAQELTSLPQDPARENPVPIRDFDVPEDRVRTGLREEIERRLDDLPYEEMSVQVDAIRKFLTQLDQRPIPGTGEDGAPGAAVREIMQSLQDLQSRGGFTREAPLPQPQPVAEASQTVLEESAAGTPFDAALSRAPKAPPAPPAVPVETAADRPAPKPHAGPDLFSARVPRTVPTPAPTPEPKAPPVLATPESVPVEPAPPAPSAQVPVRALPMAVVEGAPESVPPVRSEGGRASSAADVRRSEMFSSAARSAQSAAPAPDTDRVEFVERLMKAARITMLKGQSRLKMTLNPPHLGSLRVDLAVRDHVLNGTLRTETAAARDMILSHLQSLKDQLEGQGIHVGSFDVNVDQAFAQARQQDPDAAPARERASAPAAAKSEAPASVAADRIRSAQFQLIDVMA